MGADGEDDRYVRWQRATREQLGTTVSLVLTLATAVLGFAASLFVGKDAVPFHGWALALFWLAGIILAFSAFCGLRVHWTRLLDFRWTARAVRIRELIKRVKYEPVSDVDWRWPSWLAELQKLKGARPPGRLERLRSRFLPRSPLLSGEDVAAVDKASVAANILLGLPNAADSEHAAEMVREFCRDQAERFGEETWRGLWRQFLSFFFGMLFIFVSIVARGTAPTPTSDKNHAPINTFGQTSQPPDSGKPQNCPSGETANGCCCLVVSSPPAETPSAAATASRLFTPLALVTGLIIVAGLLLLLYGNRPLARRLGALTLLSGLTGHLIHEVKIDNFLKVDGVKIEAGVRAELNRLGPLGSEYLGYVQDFDPGKADVRPEMRDTINAVCATWKNRVAGGKDGLLLVVGATDRVPLSPSSRRQYESNFGLARARAEAVRGEIAECGVPKTEMLALVSGPKNTPESVGLRTPPSGFPEDRRVDIWGLWGRPTPEAKSQSFQTSVDIKRQKDQEK